MILLCGAYQSLMLWTAPMLHYNGNTIICYLLIILNKLNMLQTSVIDVFLSPCSFVSCRLVMVSIMLLP